MFELLKTDTATKARLGRLTTAHGVVDTPVYMPVGTQASVKAMDPR
ncbi:MAG: tRNA guanosine(34) transglycosylase Tgt, partial [Verrucomicrobiota bacterium]